MNYWLIADTHLGHLAITERFGRIKGFEEKIFSSLRVMSSGDVLIHLGDVAFKIDMHGRFHKHIPEGVKKWLIKGNHDRRGYKWYLEHGWDFVAEEVYMDIYGEKVLFSHIPVHPMVDGVNIHGHTHGREVNIAPEKNSYLISIENSLRPVTLRSAIEEYRRNNDLKR